LRALDRTAELDRLLAGRGLDAVERLEEVEVPPGLPTGWARAGKEALMTDERCRGAAYAYIYVSIP
jgi:hypothetical protein